MRKQSVQEIDRKKVQDPDTILWWLHEFKRICDEYGIQQWRSPSSQLFHSLFAHLSAKQISFGIIGALPIGKGFTRILPEAQAGAQVYVADAVMAKRSEPIKACMARKKQRVERGKEVKAKKHIFAYSSEQPVKGFMRIRWAEHGLYCGTD